MIPRYYSLVASFMFKYNMWSKLKQLITDEINKSSSDICIDRWFDLHQRADAPGIELNMWAELQKIIWWMCQAIADCPAKKHKLWYAYKFPKYTNMSMVKPIVLLSRKKKKRRQFLP